MTYFTCRTNPICNLQVCQQRLQIFFIESEFTNSVWFCWSALTYMVLWVLLHHSSCLQIRALRSIRTSSQHVPIKACCSYWILVSRCIACFRSCPFRLHACSVYVTNTLDMTVWCTVIYVHGLGSSTVGFLAGPWACVHCTLWGFAVDSIFSLLADVYMHRICCNEQLQGASSSIQCIMSLPPNFCWWPVSFPKWNRECVSMSLGLSDFFRM